MIRNTRRFAVSLYLLLALGSSAYSQVNPQARRLITQAIDNRKQLTLPGNTRPEATAANDRGRVAAMSVWIMCICS